jgi:hypothetical protein
LKPIPGESLESIIGELDWQRLALTPEQKEEYNLPAIIKPDKRFTNGGGVHEAVETEALSQTVIVDIVARHASVRGYAG